MIHWTFAQSTKHTTRHLAENLNVCFSEPELAEYRRIAVPKRADEWLFSRWVVKNLVGRVLGTDGPEMRGIRIRKEPTGMPFIEVAGRREGWLSHSHSREGVLAAFSRDPDCRFGVDLEYIEPRSSEMIGDFFTQGEMDWVLAYSGDKQTLAANLVWSAKEAYLKAVGLGLGMDTRRVEILPCALNDTASDWQSLNFKVDGQYHSSFKLLYQVESGYVLTACENEKPGVELFRQ